MTDPMIDFGRVTDRVTELLDRIDDAHLPAPTPCAEYAVTNLLDHALGLTWVFTSAAQKERGPHTDNPPGRPTEADPRWRELLPERLAALAEAWSEPEAWQGEATAGGVTLPADVMGLVALNEVAVHGWDLARATDQGYDLPADVTATLVAFVGHDADDQAARDGIYGPAVPVPDGATPLERLIGLTGRDPAWRP